MNIAMEVLRNAGPDKFAVWVRMWEQSLLKISTQKWSKNDPFQYPNLHSLFSKLSWGFLYSLLYDYYTEISKQLVTWIERSIRVVFVGRNTCLYVAGEEDEVPQQILLLKVK